MIGLRSRTTSPSSVDQQPQDPVRRGVVRAEVDRQELLLDALALHQRLARGGDVERVLLAAVVGDVGHAV